MERHRICSVNWKWDLRWWSRCHVEQNEMCVYPRTDAGYLAGWRKSAMEIIFTVKWFEKALAAMGKNVEEWHPGKKKWQLLEVQGEKKCILQKLSCAYSIWENGAKKTASLKGIHLCKITRLKFSSRKWKLQESITRYTWNFKPLKCEIW